VRRFTSMRCVSCIARRCLFAVYTSMPNSLPVEAPVGVRQVWPACGRRRCWKGGVAAYIVNVATILESNLAWEKMDKGEMELRKAIIF